MISFVAIFCTIATSRIKHKYFVTNPLYFCPQQKEGEIFGIIFLGNVLAHINIGFNYREKFHCISIKHVDLINSKLIFLGC